MSTEPQTLDQLSTLGPVVEQGLLDTKYGRLVR